MKNTNTKRGFTLIELLVVIVILGILSTISVGTFRSYFSKARDSERVSTVQNVAMMIKVDSGGIGDCTVYNYTNNVGTCVDAKPDFTDLFGANDFSMATPKNDSRYFYGFLANVDNNNDFFITVGAEEEGAQNGREVMADATDVAGSVFVDGTVGGITEMTAEGAWGSTPGALSFTCPAGWDCGQICPDGTLDTVMDATGCDNGSGTAGTPMSS